MTKEELEQRAEEYADTVKCEWENDTYWVDCRDEVTDAYIAGATENGIQWHDLRKENAELKTDNVEWEKASDKWKSLYYSTNNQLTKAKKLLEMVIDWQMRCGNGYPIWEEVIKKIQNFLKESEVEK